MTDSIPEPLQLTTWGLADLVLDALPHDGWLATADVDEMAGWDNEVSFRKVAATLAWLRRRGLVQSGPAGRSSQCWRLRTLDPKTGDPAFVPVRRNLIEGGVEWCFEALPREHDEAEAPA